MHKRKDPKPPSEPATTNYAASIQQDNIRHFPEVPSESHLARDRNHLKQFNTEVTITSTSLSSSKSFSQPQPLRSTSPPNTTPIQTSALEIIVSALRQLTESISQLASKVQDFDRRIIQLEESNEPVSDCERKKPKKGSGHCANTFVCPVQSCKKTYGTELSFHLHIRLKHSGLLAALGWDKQHNIGQQTASKCKVVPSAAMQLPDSSDHC